MYFSKPLQSRIASIAAMAAVVFTVSHLTKPDADVYASLSEFRYPGFSVQDAAPAIAQLELPETVILSADRSSMPAAFSHIDSADCMANDAAFISSGAYKHCERPRVLRIDQGTIRR